MSYLSEELVRQMTAKKLPGVRLAELTGFSASQISKWVRDEQTSITEAQLTAIQTALGDDPHAHARLVLAHLLDEKFGLAHERIELSVRDDGVTTIQDHGRHMSKGEIAVAYLAQERPGNRELNDLLIDLARLMGCNFKTR